MNNLSPDFAAVASLGTGRKGTGGIQARVCGVLTGTTMRAIAAWLICALLLASSSCAPRTAKRSAVARKASGPLFVIEEQGKFGYIDRRGRVVIPSRFDYAFDFSEGLAPANLGADKGGIGGKWGYIDTAGRFVIKPRFTLAEPFAEGLAAAAVKVGGEDSYGYINHSGRFVIKPQYTETSPFSDGLALVGDLSGSNYIDRTGKVVISGPFVEAGSFSEGRAMVGVVRGGGNCYGYIDRTGKFIIKPQFTPTSSEYPALDFSEGLAAVEIRGKYGYIDRMGRVVISPRWSEGENPLGSFHQGLAFALKGGKWGYLDKRGRFAIKPQFAGAEDFADGLAPVAIEVGRERISPNTEQVIERWGYIDRTGRFVVKPQFEDAEPISDGLGLVTFADSTWGYVNTSGKVLWRSKKPQTMLRPHLSSQVRPGRPPLRSPTSVAA